MSRQAVIDWIKQRPWLLVPLLGLIPLVSLAAVQRHSSSPGVAIEASPSPVLPTAVVSLPSAGGSSPSPRMVMPSTQAPGSQPAQVPVQPLPPASAIPQKGKVATARVQPGVVQPAFNLSVDAAVQMRVLIHKDTGSLRIATSAGGDVVDVRTGKRLYQLPAQVAYDVQADGQTIWLGRQRLPSLVWLDPAGMGITYVGDRGYRGRLLLVCDANRLWVVNHVNLQQYLHSVVGSEVSPSWPMEALKAQAVAARSYALTYHLKPVNRQLYDLGDDEYFQVYKGIESEAKTSRQAVNSTSGEFVSYRGGVVESLYAATDDIVMDAFQGQGMSQIGALGMAERGYGYRQILSSYYSGTGIGRIEMDVE